MSRFGLGFIGAGGTPGNDAFTKILLHMDGSNGGTTFTDANIGGSAHTWTPTNATTRTSNSKFGSASLLTAAGYITTPDHADFTLSSSDWTMDGWLNANSTSGVVGLAGQTSTLGGVAQTSITINRNASGAIVAQAAVGGTFFTVTGTTAFTDSVWRHFAFLRTGNILRLYINGAQEGGDKALSGAINNSSNNWSVGRMGENTTFTASSVYIDEFRLSVGIARWTSNFSVPTGPYV